MKNADEVNALLDVVEKTRNEPSLLRLHQMAKRELEKMAAAAPPPEAVKKLEATPATKEELDAIAAKKPEEKVTASPSPSFQPIKTFPKEEE